MATPNRAAIIKKTLRVLRKHYEPHQPDKSRTLLEHLLFACLVENSNHEAAERAFATLERDFFDLNEVRVSSVKELADGFRGLNDPEEAAVRLKKTLHSVFEDVYAFDLEPFKKQNIGQSVKTLERYDGTTPFVIAYVTQTALGGHSIPVNSGLLMAFQVLGGISDSEAKKGVVPGLERAVPKAKGVEISSLLHQLGVEVGRSPYGATTRKLLLEIDPDCRDRLPKRPTKPAAAEAEAPPSKGKTKGSKKSTKKRSNEQTESDAPAKKHSAKRKLAKKTVPLKKKRTPTSDKTSGKKKVRKKTTSRLSKKKPR